MKKILIGTHNIGKFKEISSLLPKKLKKISPQSLQIKSPRETGKTFIANAQLKANYFFSYCNFPVISDDSGLCIKALQGKPGIYSARWSKKYGGFKNAMKLILKKMKKKSNRSAHFISCLSYKSKKNKMTTVTGKVYGEISQKIVGSNGFGYDPIFIPKGRTITFAQMKYAKKIKIDHRFIAFKKMKKRIKTF